MIKQFNKIFQPRSIAAIGASDQVNSVGYALMKNLLAGGFKGNIYPINIKHATVQDKKAYSKVADLPEKVDLAVIATPAPTVPKLVKECGEAGIEGIIIISAGFNEMGEAGKKSYATILKIARQYNIRVIGPNCLGIINPTLGINASFSTKMPLPGKMALISQSGAICTSILDWSVEQNVGFSHFVSVGSMVDIDFADLIDYFGADPKTSCILIYMESLTNARRFMSAARAFSKHKPIIVLKAGKSQEGAQAASSHTGAMAGNDAVFDAAFRRAGVIRVDTIAQLFHLAAALPSQQLPKNNRLAIVTNGGGPGVLATDYLMSHGGQMATLSNQNMQQLSSFLPAHWSHGNPIDILGDATAETYKKALEVCLTNPDIDGILTILTPQSMTRPAEVAEALVQVSKKTTKTMLASWMGEKDVAAAREILEANNIPHYRYPESAVEVFLKMVQYSKNIKLLYETPPAITEALHLDKKAASHFIEKIQAQGQSQLSESEAKQLLSYYGIPLAPHQVVHSPEEAYTTAEKIGFPLVMKVVSLDIAHKTEIGGVVLHIETAEAAVKAYEQIMNQVKASHIKVVVEGILMEKMVQKRHELLIGAKKDSIFGPVIVFGRGGIETEIYKDIKLGLVPLNRSLAKQIIEETKVYQAIKGFRGIPNVNMVELESLLVKFAYLVMDFPEIKEIDINPFLMDEKGGVAVDAHVVLDDTITQIRPYAHLSIPPYPKQYTKNIQLKNSQKTLLRSIRPEDEPMEAAMFKCLSKQTIYQRFFQYFSKPSHDFLARFTNIDYDREIAIVAEIEEQGIRKMVAVVRLVADAWNEKAEYAIVVADDWQGQGLGNQMTNFIIEIAKERKIKTLYADVLSQNEAMLHLFFERGFEVKRREYDTKYVELQLAD